MAKPNMLVSRFLAQNKMENLERSAITAFSFGVATEKHFNILNDVWNLLNVANQLKPNDKHKPLIDIFSLALVEIRQRYEKTGKFGFNAANKKAMVDMINFNSRYWLGHSTDFFAKCLKEVEGFYDSQN